MTSPRKVVIDIVGDADKYGKATNDAIRSSEGLAGKLKAIDQRMQSTTKGGIVGSLLGGMGVGAGLGVFSLVSKGISSVTDTFSEGLTLASDKAEAASKANVLFGNSYSIIERASRSAADSVGLSSGAYLAAAGDLGNLVKNLGYTGDAAADMSRDMIQLAADMGSFHNADTTEVTQAMGAAFRGETEPIRRYGVMLDAASVAAKAVEMGLARSTKEVDRSARAQATWALILEQTKDAQGDLARTSDGMANSTKILNAKFDEMKTTVGEQLQPVMLKLLQTVSDLIPAVGRADYAVTDFVESIAKTKGPTSEGVDVIASMRDGVQALDDALRPHSDEVADFVRAQHDLADSVGVSDQALTTLFYTYKDKLGQGPELAKKSVIGFLATLRYTETASKAVGTVLLATLGPRSSAVAGVAAGVDTVTEIVAGMGDSMADAMREDRDNVSKAARDLAWVIKHPMYQAKTAGRAAMLVMGDDMAAALHDKRKTVRDGAAAIRRSIVSEFFETEDGTSRWYRMGAKVARQIGAGMKANFQFTIDENGNIQWRNPKPKPGEDSGGVIVGENATGTTSWRGGPTIIGEAGPELMDLPRGTRITRNAELGRALSAGPVVNNNITVHVSVAPTANLADVGREITAALRAYGRSGGIPAMKGAIGAR